MMRHVLLLLLGAHLAYAGKHSLRYFYTAVSGDIDFPEFTAVGLVDEGQFIYFDSSTKKALPKTEWIRENVGADYWDSQTQGLIGTHQSFKNNIQVAKERFNQSTGIHTNQRMYGCDWDDQTGATNGFFQDGYDGEDFLHLDLKELRWISPVQQGFITIQKLNKDTAQAEFYKQYFSTQCIEWLKKYLQYGKSSLEKTVSPQVSLLQKDPSSPVACHATGFYPSRVKISWIKDRQEHDEDVDLGELLPNEDGTFQKTSKLTVTPDEWKKTEYKCVVEHQGETIRKVLTENEIITNIDSSDSITTGIVVGVVAVVVLLVAFIGFVVYKKCLKKKDDKKGYMKGSNAETDSEKSDEPLQSVATSDMVTSTN